MKSDKQLTLKAAIAALRKRLKEIGDVPLEDAGKPLFAIYVMPHGGITFAYLETDPGEEKGQG